MNKTKSYDVAIDILRIIAILAVILIHTTTRTLEVVKYDLNSYLLTFSLNQIPRFAVPIFILISGFVLELNYDSNMDYRKYFQKRINKIFIPYVFWSFLYYFFIYKTHSTNFLQALLEGNASYQLYFIPTLIIFYLLFPFLHKFFTKLENFYFLSALLIIELYLLYTNYTFGQFPFFYPLSIMLLNYFFFLFGMVISKNLQKLLMFGKYIWLILIFLLINMFLVVNQGYTNYLKTHDYFKFYSSFRPIILTYTILIFLFLYLILSKINWNKRIIKKISSLSFFVFFVHVVILELTWNLFAKGVFEKLNHTKNFVFFDLIFFCIVTSVSFLSAFLIHK